MSRKTKSYRANRSRGGAKAAAAEIPYGPRPAVAAGIIVFVTAAIFANSFWGDFVFDDMTALIDNWNIRDITDINRVLAAKPPSRILVSISLAINYAISKFKPWSYHLVNLLVHLLAALALFGIVRRTLLSERLRDRFAQAATPLALAVAILWAVHPLQTQSVTYVIQRAESMMGLFYLLTLYAAIRGFASAKAWRWYIASFLACAAGMATKQVMVTAPLMVLLYDCVFVSGSPLKALRRHGRFYLALAASWGVLAALHVLSESSSTAGFGIRLQWWSYSKTQFEVILHYLRLVFWPSGLCLDPFWPIVKDFWSVWPQAVIILGLVALSGIALWRQPAWGFLGAWFFLILAPTSSIMPIADPMFEHRMYLSLAAVVAAVVMAVCCFAGRLLARLPGSPAAGQTLRVAGFALLTVAIGALGWRTIDRNRDYYSEDIMWEDIFQKAPHSSRAHNGRGVSLARQEKYYEAAQAFENSLKLEPGNLKARMNFARTCHKLGWHRRAITQYRLILSADKNFEPALNNLAWLRATHQDPAFRNGEEAVRLASRAADLTKRRDSALLDTLAAAYAEAGRFDQAVETMQEAIRLAGELNRTEELEKFRERLDLFQAGQPFRQPLEPPVAEGR